jgi:hypothetical protein
MSRWRARLAHCEPGDSRCKRGWFGRRPRSRETCALRSVAGLADSIRANVPEPLWPRLIDRLRRDLGVTAKQSQEVLE